MNRVRREPARRLRALADLEPDKGEGLLGVALIQAFFTGFRVFDEFTRTTIDEITWSEFQQVIGEEILPSLDEIRQRLRVARKDRGFSLQIPVITLNRRGLYTPLQRDEHARSVP